MEKDVLIRFLDNRCTADEIGEIVRWFQTTGPDEAGKIWGWEEWNCSQPENGNGCDEKFSLLFDKIQHTIDCEIQEKRKTRKKGAVLYSITTWITRAAAILFLPVLAFLIYTLSGKDTGSARLEGAAVDSLEIIAPVGSRTVVQLSDGSLVNLNFGSKIKYPQHFSGDFREVILTGEGYFDVFSDPDRPFIVRTGKLNIKATGTSFNVLAYPELNIIETTLVKGKVVLEKSEGEGKSAVIGSMLPGQHVSYDVVSGAVTSSLGNVEKYISWKDGKLIFDDASIVQVAEKLSRMYNVEIKVSDEIKDLIYTVTFTDEPLSQICHLMTIATPVRYKTFPRKKLPDGTFTKQKILFEKRP